MATSGTYTFSVTRDDIIRQALLNIGKLDPYEVPDSQQTRDCAIVLNMMAKQWQGKADFGTGLKVWSRKRGNLFLKGDNYQYTLGPGGVGWTLSYNTTTTTAAVAAGLNTIPVTSVTGMLAGDYIGFVQTDASIFWTTVAVTIALSVVTTDLLPVGVGVGANVIYYTDSAPPPVLIEAVVLRDENDNDNPLKIIRTTQEYDALPTKVQIGYKSDPTMIFYETGLTHGTLYTDCGSSNDLTKRLIITYMSAMQDFNNPLDEPYFPQEYFLPLCWGLSKLISPQFNRVWTPLMEDNYKMAVGTGKGKDAEVSDLYFQPGED
jgi:hypothetical protein